MSNETGKASLKSRYLIIALGPPLVYLINLVLLQSFGVPFDAPPTKAAQFDVHSEGAARYGMLAALMLFVGACLAALSFFVYTLRMLDTGSKVAALLTFAALAAAAVVVPPFLEGKEGFDYSGRSLACFAAGYGPAVPPQVDSGNAVVGPPAARSLRPEILGEKECTHERFAQMRGLGRWQHLGVILSFSALVLGAICCLAPPPNRRTAESPPPPAPTPADAARQARAPAVDEPAALAAAKAGTPVIDAAAPVPEPAADPVLSHWEEQSRWLNTYLYLAALLLVTALLFIHAYLRWPGFVLEDRTGYDNHMGALVSYYGFTFTVMLAAFYVPVATILSHRVEGKKVPEPGESKLPKAFAGPVQLLKIVLALFSSAFAGALPSILDNIV